VLTEVFSRGKEEARFLEKLPGQGPGQGSVRFFRGKVVLTRARGKVLWTGASGPKDLHRGNKREKRPVGRRISRQHKNLVCTGKLHSASVGMFDS
jgi:hypothetical protein